MHLTLIKKLEEVPSCALLKLVHQTKVKKGLGGKIQVLIKVLLDGATHALKLKKNKNLTFNIMQIVIHFINAVVQVVQRIKSESDMIDLKQSKDKSRDCAKNVSLLPKTK